MDIQPHGPRKIVGVKHQVTLAVELLEALELSVGDAVWLAQNPDRPGTLVLIPAKLMAEIFLKGWTATG